MNDLPHPDAADPSSDVNLSALRRPCEDPLPQVDARALAGRTTEDPPRPPSRRRHFALIGGIAVLIAGLAGAGSWWQSAVTGDPRMLFDGGLNGARDMALSDVSGINHRTTVIGEQLDVAFVPGGRLYVRVWLVNGGRHDVRIERLPSDQMFYWAFDGASLGPGRDDDQSIDFAHRYRPFAPFTLRAGQSRELRLEFRLADCDPAGLQDGASVVDGWPVRYRILGTTRTVRVAFNRTTLALQATGECSHPLVRTAAS
ncbi:MAG TPA: hypothetical protein VHL53_04290 [Acidimicrobiia bacterium]|nr:hypothetical protein [Acidimicrobiia bacterium]